MITLIQTILQKHYKWLLSLLLGVVIVSFVFSYGASGGFGSRNKTAKLKFYGFDLYSEQVRKRLFEGANLSLYLHTQRVAQDQTQLEQMGLLRASLLQLADSLGLPEPPADLFLEFIQKRPLFLNEAGAFDAQKYNAFQSSMANNSEFGEGFARQTLLDDYRIEKVESLLKGPSYLLPSQIQKQASFLHTIWTTSLATCKLEDFDPKILLELSELESFYHKNASLYCSPQRLKLSYILFKEPQAQVQANDFVYKLYSQSVTYGSDFFNTTLKENKLKLIRLDPLNINNLPEKSPIPRQVILEAFQLDEENYFTSPIDAEEGTYVLFLEKIIPKSQEPLDAVMAKVKKDYQKEKRYELFLAHSQSLYNDLSNSKTLGDFQSTAKRLDLKVSQVPPFTITHAPSSLDLNVLHALENLEPGKVSNPIMGEEKVTFVYLLEKQEPNIEENSAPYNIVKEQLSAVEGYSRVQMALGQLLQEEMQRINNQ